MSDQKRRQEVTDSDDAYTAKVAPSITHVADRPDSESQERNRASGACDEDVMRTVIFEKGTPERMVYHSLDQAKSWVRAMLSSCADDRAAELEALASESRRSVARVTGELKDKLTLSEDECRRLEARSEKFRTECGELRMKAEQAEDTVADMKHRNAELESENQDFKKVSRVVTLENENSRLTEETQRLSRLIDKYRARLAQYKSAAAAAAST